MGHETTLQRWNTETDATDWPRALPAEEREPLIGLVRDALAMYGAKGAHLTDVERAVRFALDREPQKAPTLHRAALWDFRFACVERALRACDAEQRWHAAK